MKLRVSKAVLKLLAIVMPTLLGAQVVQPETYVESVLHSFTGGTDGQGPRASLIRDAEGNLYGVTLVGGSGHGTVFKVSKAGTFTVLHQFAGADGSQPEAALVQDKAGNLFGTTFSGGKSGLGTVFRLTKAGKETVLHNFSGGADGAYPSYGALVQDAQDNLYGTTGSGGDFGGGIVFKLDKSGKEKVLYSFTGGPDGSIPYGGVIRDPEGNLYGTTYAGGKHGFGTVFKLNQSGKETVLHNFYGGKDGTNPYAGLIRDARGNLYGTTTVGGGGLGCSYLNPGCGTVFKLDITGKETVLYRFSGGSDGSGPVAALVRDANGNLYGATTEGGDFNTCPSASGCGVVFRVDRQGNETVLYAFSGEQDGRGPYAGLVRDSAGTLYGTTIEGGTGGCADGCGAVFQLGLTLGSAEVPEQ